jgi:AraC family transcriptional regulator of adaptative response / DNA-3-methyladenine glycosylase II
MQALTRDEMLARCARRDPSSELDFIVGVLSTGIYCLPTCRARRPNPRNVRFFDSPQAARKAGLRACKRCRPDQAHARRDPELEALETAVTRLRADPGQVPDVAAFAALAGVGTTKLGALLRRHFHATPRALLLRARVEHASAELLASRRPTLAIGLEAGFESATAFQDNFRAHTGLAPGAFREQQKHGGGSMELPGGLDVGALLGMLGRDPESRTERVVGSRLLRALRLPGGPALLEVDFRGSRAHVRVHAAWSLGPGDWLAAETLLQRVLGLRLDPGPFERRARREPDVARLIEPRRGLRILQTPDVFEGLVWTIVGQQVNLAFAFTCRNRLIDLAGEPLAGAPAGMRAHPDPEQVARLDYADLVALQFSRRKAEYLIDAARAICAGSLDLDGLRRASATRARRELGLVRGLGRWSVDYILMRSLGFGDCVPVGDAGLVRALAEFYVLEERPDDEQTVTLMEPFAPHRSFAAMHLWKSLGEPT